MKKRLQLKVKQTKQKSIFNDTTCYILSFPIPFSKMGRDRVDFFFPLQKYLICSSLKKGHRKTMLSKFASRSFRRIFQMSPYKL